MIHASDPFQLVFCFQLLSDSIKRFHLRKKQLHPLMTSPVDLMQMSHKLTRKQKSCVEAGTFVLEIILTHMSILADRFLVEVTQAKIRKPVVSTPMVGKLHKGYLSFRCNRKCSYDLKVSLQAITA